jgi:hypothetical protein
MITEHQEQIQFLIELAGGYTAYLQQNQLDNMRTSSLLEIIEYCIKSLCHLSDSSNPCQPMAIQIASFCIQLLW